MVHTVNPVGVLLERSFYFYYFYVKYDSFMFIKIAMINFPRKSLTAAFLILNLKILLSLAVNSTQGKSR